MERSSRTVFLSLAVTAALLPAALAAGAPQKEANAGLEQRLMPLYQAAKADASLRAMDLAAHARPGDKAAMDAFLRRMPLSPLAYLQIDMEVNHYEIMVPSTLQDLHVRWIQLNEEKARGQYGNTYVDQILSGWPVDTGQEALAVRASVGTNRNVGGTSVPVATAFDGEIQIAVNHRNTNQIVSAANTWNTSVAACNNNQTQSIFYSSDGGATWGHTCAPSNNVWNLGTCSGTVFGSDPAVYWNDSNEVFLNYMLLCGTATTTKYSMVVARSADGGATWSAQGIIKNAWATGTLEDKNFYVIDNTTASPFYGRHYTCWDRSNNEKFAYSSNNGVSWTEVDLPTAPVGGIDLGCEIAVQKNGTVHVVWESLTCGANCTDERMWYTKSTNGGVSWSSPVQVHDHNLNGFAAGTGSKPPVADNRGISPFGAVDVDNSGGACDGTLYATYCDFTSGGATETDIWVTRSTNGGTTWSTPVKVNDDGLAGRTQFHPFLQVDQSNGSVVVGWHDARNDAANRKVDYYTSRSTDCGVSFEANTKASQNSAEFNNSGISYTDENTTDNPNRNPNQYGEYLGLDVKNGKAYMSWVDSRHFYPGSSTDPQKENLGFAVIDFGAACVPPAAPTGLTATTVSASQINLSWTAVAGATSYNVYRSTVSGGPYTLAGSSATTSFSNTGLACNTAYFYVVRAVAGCESGNSNQATATTSVCPTCTTQTLYNHTFESPAAGLDGFSVGTFVSGGSTATWRGVQTCTAAGGTKIFRYGGTSCTANYTNNNFNFAQANGAGGISIPAGSTTARLTFAHRRAFESGFDGGTLAISTNGTSYTFVPAAAILAGGYTGTVSASCPPAGSAGTSIWTGVSTSFTSTTVDLDAACNAIAGNTGGCAGKAVRIAFTSITDCSAVDDGWFLDNVAVQACVP